MAKPEINIVWFKRDLRLTDHAPLQAAIESGIPVLLCYCFEPSLLQHPTFDLRHGRFLWESTEDLNRQLQRVNISFYRFHREVIPVLRELSTVYTIHTIFSHQETGLKITFDRDREVKRFCQQHQIRWKEYRQDGVIRGLKNREGWQQNWESAMKTPLVRPDLKHLRPVRLPAQLLERLQLPPLPLDFKERNKNFQPGGPSAARRYWQSFLDHRAEHYSRHLSKPAQSRVSCSRLSPYIAFGNISAREIYQSGNYNRRSRDLDRPLQNFLSRVWWRSHYLQKLESEWQMEFEPLNRGMQALDRHEDPQLFSAWSEGRTGMPMVDASMRCLQATGWLNFRMRAMLVTYATFTLWLDWKMVAHHLARVFLDFEPGIHYGQIQMQAGLTGYHTLRIFNPTVQSEKHDSVGAFVKKWVPELVSVPTPELYTPWEIPPLEQAFMGWRIGEDYPMPVKPYASTTRKNKDRYWTIRQSREVQDYLPKLWQRHCLPANIEIYKKQLNWETSTAG